MENSVRRIEPHSKEYKKLVYQEAIAFCPQIYPCQKCGYPVINGYCCPNCHDSNPSEKEGS